MADEYFYTRDNPQQTLADYSAAAGLAEVLKPLLFKYKKISEQVKEVF
jgi:hypothetical protein